MKQFNTTAVLTSKNPEAFVNITYDSSNLWIIPVCSIDSGMLSINGLDSSVYTGTPSLDYALKLDATNNIASFLVYSDVNYNFDANLSLRCYSDENLSVLSNTYDISILNRPFIISQGIINSYDNDDILIEGESSYLLMRTNPKYSGNIALYIDTSENMYLDTFQISDILSNKKYRKQKVSANSVLSSDIRNTFSSLPLGELYKVDKDNTLSIAIPKTEYKNQYITTYNYGARLLKDELYSEDYGLLAPLWINSKLPDYFAVFRLSGVYNTETYDSSIDKLDLASKYFSNSDIIKTWSLKPSSALGKYLTTHLSEISGIQSPVFLSLTDPSINDADPNTWYGIAVDKGVVTGRSETTYFFNQKSSNYTDLNAFVSQGFERNTLLCPNLLNLNFIFDDNEADEYSMNRYFGLYMTENIMFNIAYYANSSEDNVEVISLDEKDPQVFFDSSIFIDGSISASYANRIFVLNDGNNLHRINNVNQINGSISNSYVSKPNKNIFSTKISTFNTNPFIMFNLNNTLEEGEHIRVINETDNIIWEAYAVDASSFSCDIYCSKSQNGNYPTVYRTLFDINGDTEYQCKQIKNAFDRFSNFEDESPVSSGLIGKNWVYIVLNDNADFNSTWKFQRITASTLNNPLDTYSGWNNVGKASDLTFFGVFNPSEYNYEIISFDSSYGPIDFEFFGDRKCLFTNFLNTANYNVYSFNSSANILDKFEDVTLYQDTSLWYRRIINFSITDNFSTPYIIYKDPFNVDKCLILTDATIKTVGDIFNAYSIYPLTISIMGINPVKDIDYTVYDTSLGYSSVYSYKREDDASTYYIMLNSSDNYTLTIPGSYTIISGEGKYYKGESMYNYYGNTLMNTFDMSINMVAYTNTLVSWAKLDGTYTYKSFTNNAKEEYISDYYDSSSLLKYGLTVPLISKWVGLGKDCRNNPIRLSFDSSILDVSTNFIPDVTTQSFIQELTYPVFKYLTPGEKAWESYIFYDINDVIYDGSSYITLKNAMFTHPEIDYFSKMVYSNYNTDKTCTRSSICYYNGYKSSIDTLFLGMSFSFKVANAAKNILNIKNYDRYRFSFISTASKNKDNKRPIEIIINENSETILMIWYQGNDELNYNMRYSTFLPGKSLLDIGNKGFVTSPQIDASYYSFVKTTFTVNNSTIQKTLNYLYDSDAYTYNSRPYAQLNKNANGLNSVWNAFGQNTISNNTFYVDGDKDYNTFFQYNSYSYTQDKNTFGDYVVNYGYNYNSNRNWYGTNTCNLNTLNYFLSSAYKNIMFYILRGDKTYTSFDFGNATPMTVTINSPRNYKGYYTYNGWYSPNFNNILDFKSNEDEYLVNVTNRDYTFSNTNLRLSNSIPQMWYNTVTDVVTPEDVSAANAISVINNFDVFKSIWDSNYYIKDGSLVNGYESPDELPSFFGSKLIKLPDQILVNNWDTTTANVSEDANNIILTYNLTRAITDMFKSNLSFVNNWGGLTTTDNIIDSYIKNTILTYYNISVKKIEVGFFYKPIVDSRLTYIYDSQFIEDNKQNFNGQLLYINDEYLYTIIIPKNANFTYFTEFTIVEK